MWISSITYTLPLYDQLRIDLKESRMSLVSPIGMSVYGAGGAQGSVWGAPTGLVGIFLMVGLAPCGLSQTRFGDDLAMPDHFWDAMPQMWQGLEGTMGAGH
jgi:hypothetical protein